MIGLRVARSLEPVSHRQINGYGYARLAKIASMRMPAPLMLERPKDQFSNFIPGRVGRFRVAHPFGIACLLAKNGKMQQHTKLWIVSEHGAKVVVTDFFESRLLSRRPIDVDSTGLARASSQRSRLRGETMQTFTGVARAVRHPRSADC